MWRTGKPGMLQPMGLQRVGLSDWTTRASSFAEVRGACFKPKVDCIIILLKGLKGFPWCTWEHLNFPMVWTLSSPYSLCMPLLFVQHPSTLLLSFNSFNQSNSLLFQFFLSLNSLPDSHLCLYDSSALRSQLKY